MTIRLRCCVPFCRQTISADSGFSEWICAKHWRLVSPEARSAYTLAKRRARRIVARKPVYREYWKLPSGSPARLSASAVWRRLDSAWERGKREAIERALAGGPPLSCDDRGNRKPSRRRVGAAP